MTGHSLNERNRSSIQYFHADLFAILCNDISLTAEVMHVELEVDRQQ
jgi:hypothetical protein